MQVKTKRLFKLNLLGLVFASSVHAAVVPAGTQLADKQQLVRNNGGDPTTLDPQQANMKEAINIISDSFAPLVSLDNHKQPQPQPELAVSWQNQDYKVWTFKLRDGLNWSDGSPITAQDVVFSWQRLADPKTASLNQSTLSDIHLLNAEQVIAGKLPPSALGIKALDTKTVQVTLSQPVTWFLQVLNTTSLLPISEAAVKKYGTNWIKLPNLVVSGAYKPATWIINERFVSKRNPYYWNDKATVIDQVTYLPIAEPGAVLNRYQSGEIDITDTISNSSYPLLKKTIPDQIKLTQLLGVYFYEVNTSKPPFNDPRVRLALSLALDKSVITNKVVGMGQQAAWGLIPLTMGGMTFKAPDYGSWTPAQRLTEAKKLLSDAGFNAERPLKFDLLYNTSQDHQRIAIALTSMWKKNLGAQVTMLNQEWKTLVQNMHDGHYTLIRMSSLANYDTPETFLTSYRSGDPNNDTKYSNPQYDKLLAQASRETDKAIAQQYYQQALDILGKEVPSIPIYYYVQNQLVKPWVGGMYVDPTGLYKTQAIYIKKH